MISKSQRQFVRSLVERKARQEYGLFVAEGARIVEDLLLSPIEIKTIFATADWLEHKRSTIPSQVEIFQIDERELEQLSQLKTPNRALALVAIPHATLDIPACRGKLVVGLESIQDPGNLGTIIRLCDWFGITQIVANSSTVNCFNAKVVQATMGSIARVQVHYRDDFAEVVSHFAKAGKRVYATTPQGESIYQAQLEPDALILLGNEGNGLSDDILSRCTNRLRIPRFGDSPHRAESLNVAVAASIVCSEFCRLLP
ncbi:MAG: RNA methyltransferase [Gemmataceae bacterium]|nr:RNA methyltransferase [Gemmataceae bacterium]